MLSKSEAKLKAKAAALAEATDKLEIAGKEIAAQVAKAKELEPEAKKCADHWSTVAQRLIAARPLCKAARVPFETFREQYAPEYKRSRLYEMLAIADGRKTVEQSRAEKRTSVAKSRAAKMSTTSAVADNAGATGNDVDTEASAEKRKAAADEEAVIDPLTGESVATAAQQPAPAPQETAEEMSDRCLAEWKKYSCELLPRLTVADQKKARVWFNLSEYLPRSQRSKAA